MKAKTWQRISPALLAGAIVLFLLLAAYFFSQRVVTQTTAAAGPAIPQQQGKGITLYLATGESDKFAQRKYSVKENMAWPDQIRGLIESMFEKPAPGEVSLWPFSLRVRSVYLLKNGLLILDLEEGVQYNQTSSAATELRVLRSIVRTLVDNFPEVQKVKLLINGSEAETLAGHLDISRAMGEEDFKP